MRLRTKIALLFGAALALNVAAIWFGLRAVLDGVSSGLMNKHAETVALLLERSAAAVFPGAAGLDPAVVHGQFDIAKSASDSAGSFDVAKILLIGADLRVVAAYPEDEVGADYSGHADIRAAFERKLSATVRETETDAQGRPRRFIDVVRYFELGDGSPLVLEVKLDFARSTAMLEAQYRSAESLAIVLAIGLLALLLGTLLAFISRAAVRPVQRLAEAMRQVGAGSLDVGLAEAGRDEFGDLARRFNEMVVGLKEKEGLSRYVSRGTAAAVKASVRDAADRTPVRRTLTLFFSDIRGFTSFAESRDPAVVIGALNAVLGLQAAVIERRGGDIDKFVGDEVMAVFEDPEPAARAALEIQAEMAARAGELLGLAIGIGLHEGEVMQGDVGSAGQRDFTVIGDAVNTAARLESVAGAGEVLISDAVLRRLLAKGVWRGKAKGKLQLKGKSQEIRAYTLSAGPPEGAA
jgi:class 3 adenylate cyclase